MVTITDIASEKLQNIMKEKSLDNYALRVFVSGGGCSGLNYGMTFAEAPETTDQTFEDNGLKIVIDPESSQYLMGAQIDYIDSLMGGGFRIDNPNAVQTCSCGSSFRTEAGEKGQSCRC